MLRKKKDTFIIAKCKNCGTEFKISLLEQKHFKNLGFELPKRCKPCRKKRSIAKKKEEDLKQAQIDAQKAVKKWAEDEKRLETLLLEIPFLQLKLEEIIVKNPNNTLFIIGNGFDMMHGVPSSYWDFQKTLGKKSQLRFHLETYLKAEDLWSDFEESLSHLNVGMMLDVMDMWLANFGAYDKDSSMSTYYGAIDTAMTPIQVITEQLPKRFRKWIECLEEDGRKPLEHIISKEAIYLNFNYTDFLETLYDVPNEKIKYIHGCRKKEEYQPKEKLILGHVPNVDYLADYKPKKEQFHSKNKKNREMLNRAIEIGTENWVSYYEQTFTKYTPEIIEDNKEFFRSLYNISQIVVIGHSLAEVDYPYFKEIIKSNDNKAEWYIGYHTYNDMKRLLELVEELDIQKEQVKIFRT